MSSSVVLKALETKVAGVLKVALPLSLVIFTYEREITPLYGAGPTSYLLDKILLAAILLSAIQPFRIPKQIKFLLVALALTFAPNATYWVAAWTARRKNPVWGPVITHASVLGPLSFLLTTFVVEMDDPDAESGKSTRPSPILRVLRGTMTFLISFSLFQRVWYPSTFLSQVSGSQIYLSLAAVYYGIWICSLPFQWKRPTVAHQKKKKVVKNRTLSSFSAFQLKAALLTLFGALWLKFYSHFSNPVLPHPLLHAYTHPSYPLRILSAEQSVTGLITVVDLLPPPNYKEADDATMHSARYLRASHSLLGGLWIRDKVQTLDNEQPIRDSFNHPLGDSIYSAFVVQEAALLVNSTSAGRTGQWNDALVIGLGVGISANALLRHDISTTIVEIDPAVFNAARKWFGLADPGPGKVFLEDARSWAAEKRSNVEAGKNETLYDVVLHDCFSGGGVPEHIFTMEFWEDLKVLMTPEAVLVVNFAGIIKSEASRLMVNTLEQSFGKCRAFHDNFEHVGEEKYETEFLNMVVFCTRSLTPLTFRHTKSSDWLGSPLRRYVLESMDSREIDLDVIRVAPKDNLRILEDDNNPLGSLQQEPSRNHWKIMREVLPSVYWETY